MKIDSALPVRAYRQDFSLALFNANLDKLMTVELLRKLRSEKTIEGRLKSFDDDFLGLHGHKTATASNKIISYDGHYFLVHNVDGEIREDDGRIASTEDSLILELVYDKKTKTFSCQDLRRKYAEDDDLTYRMSREIKALAEDGYEIGQEPLPNTAA